MSIERTSAHFDRLASFLVVVILLNCTVATALVLGGDLPPVFNQQILQYRLLNVLSLLVLIALLGLLAGSLFTDRLTAVRRPILLAAAFILSLEAMLFL